MVDYFISLPLYEEPYFTYNFAAQGNSYNLEFVFNERVGLYYINLYDADNNPLVLGVALVPSYPIMKDYALSPLDGFFWMEEKSTIISEPYKQYPDKINEYYNLFYLYSEEE